MPEQVPSQIGRYRILGVVGQWTVDLPDGPVMSWLYRGHDDRLDRDVWVKTLSPTVTNDPMARARFMREAGIAAGLCHPNIIEIMEFGEYEGMPFNVFEALEGNGLLEPMDRSIRSRDGRALRPRW